MHAILKGTLILTVAGMVVKVIGFLNWIILSRVLGGEGIGLYQMAFPVYLLALSVSSAGIPVAISIVTAERLALNDIAGAKRVFRVTVALMTVSGLIFSILLFFGADWLISNQFIRDPRAYYSIIALAPAVFFVTILASYRGYLQGWQIMTPTAVSQIVEQLVRVATMLLFASWLLPRGLDWAAGGASLGAAPGAFFGLLIVMAYAWRLKPGDKMKTASTPQRAEAASKIIKRILQLALPISLSSLMLPVVAIFDMLIVPVRLEAAGYSVEQATELYGYLTGMAVPLVNLATILTAALATSIIPAVSEAFALGDKQRIFERTARAMRIANVVTIPAAVALFILAEPVASLVYHAPAAAPAVRIMAVGVFVLGLHQVTTGVLQGMSQTTIPVINMGIAAIAKVGLNWALTAIPALGIQGAAWATVADFGLAAVLNLYFIWRFTRYSINLLDLARMFAAAAIMGGVMYGVYDVAIVYVSIKAFATLAAIVAGVIVYGAVLLTVGGIEQAEIRQIPLIGSRLAAVLNKLGVFRDR